MSKIDVVRAAMVEAMKAKDKERKDSSLCVKERADRQARSSAHRG